MACARRVSASRQITVVNVQLAGVQGDATIRTKMAATGMFAALLLFCIVKQVVTGSSFPGPKTRGEVECNICDGSPNSDFVKSKAASFPSFDVVPEVKARFLAGKSSETKSAARRDQPKLECNICDFQLNTEFAKQGAVNSLSSSSHSTGSKINPTAALLEAKSVRARDSVECNICDYVPISEFGNGGRTTLLSSELPSEEKMASATTSFEQQCVVAEAEQTEAVLSNETPQERQQDSSKSEETLNSTATCHFLDHIVLPSHADLLKTALIGGLAIRAESLSVSA
ncbi:hypothetical protein Aduo_011061 [Ancylostoma duodenale]